MEGERKLKEAPLFWLRKSNSKKGKAMKKEEEQQQPSKQASQHEGTPVL